MAVRLRLRVVSDSEPPIKLSHMSRDTLRRAACATCCSDANASTDSVVSPPIVVGF
jgi:hypothetical protein